MPQSITEEEIDKMVNDLAMAQTLSLLRLLALGFTENTKLLAVPNGTRRWQFEFTHFDDNSNYHETYLVMLYNFFGMVVGYDPKTDTLIMWKP